jgi:hypothetical protein
MMEIAAPDAISSPRAPILLVWCVELAHLEPRLSMWISIAALCVNQSISVLKFYVPDQTAANSNGLKETVLAVLLALLAKIPLHCCAAPMMTQFAKPPSSLVPIVTNLFHPLKEPPERLLSGSAEPMSPHVISLMHKPSEF